MGKCRIRGIQEQGAMAMELRKHSTAQPGVDRDGMGWLKVELTFKTNQRKVESIPRRVKRICTGSEV